MLRYKCLGLLGAMVACTPAATPDRFVGSSFVRQLDENGSCKQLLSGA